VLLHLLHIRYYRVLHMLCCCRRFGGFGSDFCSGNTQEMWRDRAEFVRLAGQRAAQHYEGKDGDISRSSSAKLIESHSHMFSQAAGRACALVQCIGSTF
jgi:hypothetical protein